MIFLYTDGACINNPGLGGYAALLKHRQGSKTFTGAFKNTTNNRMELMGVIIGLEAIKIENQQVAIYTDSRYIVDSINRGWLKKWLVSSNFKGKKNQDLWHRLWKVYKQHQIEIHWVKGHTGHTENEYCDTLATRKAKQGTWKQDHGYKKT